MVVLKTQNWYSYGIFNRGLASSQTWFLHLLCLHLGELTGQLRLRSFHVRVRQPVSITRLDWRPGIKHGVCHAEV